MERYKKFVTSMVLLSLLVSIFLVPVRHLLAAPSIPFLPKGFGGVVTEVDYTTCSCGFIIVTVTPKGDGEDEKYIFLWVAQVIEKILGLLGISLEGFLNDFGIPLVIPRLYHFLPPSIFFAYEQNILGNYIPVPNAPCAKITWPYCSIVYPDNAAGYLYNVGTSLLPSSDD